MLTKGFYVPGSWQRINDHLAGVLGVSNLKINIQYYEQVYQALAEKLLSLSRLHLAKKKIYFVQGSNPYFYSLAKTFAADGFSVKMLTLSEALSDEFPQSVEKDCLAFVYPEDLPKLAEVFVFSNVCESLNEKRVFQIGVSFHRHKFEHFPNEILDYGSKILVFDDHCTVVATGSRAYSTPIFAEQQNFDFIKATDYFQHYKIREQKRSLVEKFESQKPCNCECLWADKNRVYDRAIFTWQNLDASALRELMVKEGCAPKYLATTSPIFWQDDMQWLLDYGLSPEQVRGTLIVSAEALSENFSENLTRAYDELLGLQSIS